MDSDEILLQFSIYSVITNEQTALLPLEMRVIGDVAANDPKKAGGGSVKVRFINKLRVVSIVIALIQIIGWKSERL